jgi:hypothetical protein
MALMQNDANRYPNEIFVRRILERPEDWGIATATARGV